MDKKPPIFDREESQAKPRIFEKDENQAKPQENTSTGWPTLKATSMGSSRDHITSPSNRIIF